MRLSIPARMPVVVLLTLVPSVGPAQDPAPTSASTGVSPCSSEEHRAFDFLLGSWTVRSASGDDAGTVHVTSVADGCALREEWTSASGRRGLSLNVWSERERLWNQVYVDTTGTVLTLVGAPVPGGMVLFDDAREEVRGDRFGWFPQPDGTVRQTWDRSTGEGDWTSVFEGVWSPTEEEVTAAGQLSEAMRPLSDLLGLWEVTPTQQGPDGKWVERPTTLLEVEPALGGKFVREGGELDLAAGRLEAEMLIGWDPFQEVYRVAWNDSLAGLADIYEGQIIDRVLVIDNLESGTFWRTPDGVRFAFRLEIELDVVDEERRARVYASDDGGENWSKFQTTLYRRAGS